MEDIMVTKNQIISVLKRIEDPELNIDVYALGLVYGIEIKRSTVVITMTFTSPICPYGPFILEKIKQEISKVNGVNKVNINLVFDPPWQPSKEVKEMIGL